MTSTRPNVVLDAKYSVAETAKLLGVHRCTVHRMTIADKLKCGKRRSNNRSFYWGREILRFWMAEA